MRRLLRAMPRYGATAWRNRALVELAYASGARLEELARLQLGSVDLEHAVVRLVGKGSRERAIPLTRLAVSSLRRYFRCERPGLLRGGTGESAALFIGVRDGAPLDAPGIAHVIQQAGRRVGLASTPHDLRRAFATHLLRGGAHVAEVRLLLGHQSYRHLARYLELTPERLTERFLGR